MNKVSTREDWHADLHGADWPMPSKFLKPNVREHRPTEASSLEQIYRILRDGNDGSLPLRRVEIPFHHQRLHPEYGGLAKVSRQMVQSDVAEHASHPIRCDGKSDSMPLRSAGEHNVIVAAPVANVDESGLGLDLDRVTVDYHPSASAVRSGRTRENPSPKAQRAWLLSGAP